MTPPRQRPHDRSTPAIAAVVLAAGRSTRMGGKNKLLVEVDGVRVIERAVGAVVESRAGPIVVVTGFDAPRVEEALRHLDVQLVRSTTGGGMSASIRAGLRALPEPSDIEGVLICLGDMPWVTTPDINAVIDAFTAHESRGISVPMHGGRQGNPVLWSTEYFKALSALEGDRGAKQLLERYAGEVHEVPAGPGVLRDVDRPRDLGA